MRPLEGIRILSLEQYGAGPFGTQYLSDMGAEVIKVENPKSGGDYARPLGPYFIEGVGEEDADSSSSSLFFQSCNRNKKSLTLDITDKVGREIFHRLVGQVDAVANNLRGDVPEKLGICYSDLAQFNPAIVCAHCSAYGREGPRKSWPGFDYLMQAETGYFSLCGEPDGPPARFGLSIVDYMAGLTMSFALVSSVLAARQTGIGRDVDVNLFDTAFFNMNYLGFWALNSGHYQQRLPRSAHPSLTPCQLYKTSDGWIYIMCNKEDFWPKLCRFIDREAWITDGRFSSFKERLRERELLTELIDKALDSRSTTEWLELFSGEIPAAPVLDLKTAFDNPFLLDGDRIQDLEHQSGKTFKSMRVPIRADVDDKFIDKGAPELGEHTEQILLDLGLNEQEIIQLRDSKTI